MSITQIITALPIPPDPDDPPTFDDRAYAFTSAQVNMAAEINTAISQINSTEADINTSEANAQAYSEAAASSANFKGDWSSSTTYALGDSCYYGLAIWRSLSAENLNHAPYYGSAYWAMTWRLSMEYGQCILKKSGSDLVLTPYNGNQILIDKESRKLSAPCTLSATGLSADTLYYIYAYMSGSTITLEASTTGHTQDSDYGHEVKIGDATRTFVGMAKTIAGPAWADTDTQRYVRSWYNRDAPAIYAALTADYTFDSAYTWTEILTVNKSILCWDGEVAIMRSACFYINQSSSTTDRAQAALGIDSGRLSPSAEARIGPGAIANLPVTIYVRLSEGEHVFRLYGWVGVTNIQCDAGSYLSVRIK